MSTRTFIFSGAFLAELNLAELDNIGQKSLNTKTNLKKLSKVKIRGPVGCTGMDS